MIKAVFIDIDDTLINSKRKITDRTKNIIENCIEKGIKIILTSGRARLDTLRYQKEVGASPYIISSNGAEIYDIENENEIYSQPISKDIVNKLLIYAQKHDCKITLNYGGEMAMNLFYFEDEKDKQRTIKELEEIIEKEKIIQCVISNREIEKLKEFKIYLQNELPEIKIQNESKRLKNPEIQPSHNYYCDIASKDISKGKAVKNLYQYLKLKKEEIIVIGDGENDISMFAETNNSVAMGNATKEVKKMAKYITNTNDEDGVAEVLEKIIK